MWQLFLIIDYWGWLRKDWEYVQYARDWLKTLPVLNMFPNFMWYFITWYSLLCPQAMILIFAIAKFYWSVVYPLKKYLDPAFAAREDANE